MQLSEEFKKKYFWDVDVTKLDLEKKYYFVISRLLDKGDVAAVKWVRNNYDAEKIKETLKKYRDFSLQSSSLWALIYQVPIKEVKCFQEPYRSTRKTHWPY